MGVIGKNLTQVMLLPQGAHVLFIDGPKLLNHCCDVIEPVGNSLQIINKPIKLLLKGNFIKTSFFPCCVSLNGIDFNQTEFNSIKGKLN